MTLRHIVSWQVEGDTPDERTEVAARLARALESLNGQIPSLMRLEAHANSLQLAGNWDLVLIADFEDEAALEAYLVHPAHQEVALKVRSVAIKRSAVDFNC